MPFSADPIWSECQKPKRAIYQNPESHILELARLKILRSSNKSLSHQNRTSPLPPPRTALYVVKISRYLSDKKCYLNVCPINIEYIWWMFPWAGPSFPVSLTMATSANGHNLTATSGHILIFYIWNKSKSQSDRTANPSLYCASRSRRDKITSLLYSVGISLVTSCSTCWCQSLTSRVLWTKLLDNSQIPSNHNSPP